MRFCLVIRERILDGFTKNEQLNKEYVQFFAVWVSLIRQIRTVIDHEVKVHSTFVPPYSIKNSPPIVQCKDPWPPPGPGR